MGGGNYSGIISYLFFLFLVTKSGLHYQSVDSGKMLANSPPPTPHLGDSHTLLAPTIVLVFCSENILTEVSTSRVYILGGLVDESVTKNLTLVKSISWNFTTARLPIQGRHFIRRLIYLGL